VLQSHIRSSSWVSCSILSPGSIDRQVQKREGLASLARTLAFVEEVFSFLQETRRNRLAGKRENFLGDTSIGAVKASSGSRADAEEFRLVDETAKKGWDDPRPVLRDSMTRRPAAKRFE